MSNLFTLPKIKDFVMQMHTAITKFKESRATKPGSSFNARIVLAITMGMSLFLIGSCNEKAEVIDFSNAQPSLIEMSKGQMVRHSYKIQTALSQDPTVLPEFSSKELKLALAKPDLKRVEGKAEIWHYLGKQCVLDVYWVKKKSNANFKQAHYEFRERRGLFQNVAYSNDGFQDWQCMQSLIQDRRSKIEANFDDLYAVLDLNEQRS